MTTPGKGIDLAALPANAGHGMRVALAVARFNAEVTEALLSGARQALDEHGVRPQDIEVLPVPGSFELPLACRELARSGRYDAVVALGCLVRGETAHFEVIAHAAAQGLVQAGLETGVPIALGVLTTYDLDQARARARPDRTNKGYEAAVAALEMAQRLGRREVPT